MTWIKICGTTNLEDAQLAADAGADALGFIFAPSARQIHPQQANQMISALPQAIEKIGIFVGQPAAEIERISKAVGLTGIQYYGHAVREIENLAAASNLKLFAALSASDGALIENAQAWNKTKIFAYLLDSARAGGGTGRRFDWQSSIPHVQLIKQHARVIVAGGLTPENVGEAIRLFRPWGVDVVSGVERSPGKKDPQKVKAFIAAVRRADSAE